MRRTISADSDPWTFGGLSVTKCTLGGGLGSEARKSLGLNMAGARRLGRRAQHQPASAWHWPSNMQLRERRQLASLAAWHPGCSGVAAVQRPKTAHSKDQRQRRSSRSSGLQLLAAAVRAVQSPPMKVVRAIKAAASAAATRAGHAGSSRGEDPT